MTDLSMIDEFTHLSAFGELKPYKDTCKIFCYQLHVNAVHNLREAGHDEKRPVLGKTEDDETGGEMCI